MNGYNIVYEIQEHIQTVIAQDTDLGRGLWRKFLELHPADIAAFFADIDKDHFKKLFLMMPKRERLEVFGELSDIMKVQSLHFMNESERVDALNCLSADDLTDLFDLFTDEELKIYLELLNKKARERVLSLLQFDPESAGGIMDTQALSLFADFTVAKSIQVLQRLGASRDIYQQIYITDQGNRLVGHIRLEDLVLQLPEKRIRDFMRKNEMVTLANQDQESIAKKMVHYGLTTVPVVDETNHFLGVISGETLVDVLVEEASEDVQKMSALAPMKYPYFETTITRLLYERGFILVGLLLAQSFSTSIMQAFQGTLSYGSLLFFTSMLISTGGNASNQSSALVIQGLASGELHHTNAFRFVRREFGVSLILALILGSLGFLRAYLTVGSITESIIIGLTLSAIVTVSVSMGSIIPLLLKRFNIDPAFSAGPFLATLMDILGILIYCYVSKLILF